MKKEEKRLTGTFFPHARGFGFVEVEGEEQDFYIPPDMTGGAFFKDQVEIGLLGESRGKNREARIVKMMIVTPRFSMPMLLKSE